MKTSSLRARLGCVLLASIASIASSGLAQAAVRSWKKIIIPGARCGNGSPYTAFLSMKDPRKFALELMGGGACWDHSTCFGPTPSTPMQALPFVMSLPDGIDSEDEATSPLASYSLLYMPYCTGDVHISARTVTFKTGFKAHQRGGDNLTRALAHVRDVEGVDTDAIDSFVVYGASAGALGALLNLSRIDAFIPARATRVMVADAPGLHFGPTFWDRFAAGFKEDVYAGLRASGMSFPLDGKPVASQLSRLCEGHPHWRFAFLQGDLDIGMSSIFGRIDPLSHRKLVYGEGGLLDTMRRTTPNCSAWIHPSMMHTFGLTGATSRMAVAEKTAHGFIADAIALRESKIYAPDGR